MFKLASEGYPFIIVFAVLTAITYIFVNPLVAVIPLGITFFMVFFFRDPERKVPEGEGLFVSPADGRVILIKNVCEDTTPPIPPLLRGGEGGVKDTNRGFIEISIFMSPLNVHVNRAPCDGNVNIIKYSPGRFKAAYKDEASIKNENIVMVLDGKEGRVLVKQVAGFLARRAVCKVKVGDVLRRGERYGIIKFGSRLDVYLPKAVRITVKLGDRVKAGETVIAQFRL